MIKFVKFGNAKAALSLQQMHAKLGQGFPGAIGHFAGETEITSISKCRVALPGIFDFGNPSAP